MEARPATERILPAWLAELDHALAFHPQFILAGNIRDLHLVPTADGPLQLDTIEAIWSLLEQRSFRYLLGFDPVDRLQVLHPDRREDRPTTPPFDRIPPEGTANIAFPELITHIQAVQPSTAPPTTAGAMLIDYASRIASPLAGPNVELDDFFVACEKLSHRAQPRGAPGAVPPPYNPIIWLANGPSDLPDSFRVGNEAVRTIMIGLPDRSTRQYVAERAAKRFPDYVSLPADQRDKLVLQFVLLTEGMTLRSMHAIQELARSREFGLEGIADAIRAYKVGTAADPWKDPTVRASIRDGEARIGRNVKGQSQAIRLAMDILKRSVTGLSGAHVGRGGSRPRGVLFFAGPTGVGKTELAKQITSTLFGDESAYYRFDMSEFSAEHSEARLIGSPPGYVGHDAGGELVNAVRERPFSVLLFDEIEKAHPRILDKFLQILEDGRLTDGRGDTVFFSEAVIIFTSNLGIYGDERRDEGVVRVQKVKPENAKTREEVERLVRPEIDHHFRFVIQRPELLNRIGDNIIVFDFIREKVAIEILEKMLGNIRQRVSEEHHLELNFSEETLELLRKECLNEAALFGGRGVGNKLESCLVNPLARALFEGDARPAGGTVLVSSIRQSQNGWELALT